MILTFCKINGIAREYCPWSSKQIFIELALSHIVTGTHETEKKNTH